MALEYITLEEASKEFDIGVRRLQILCKDGRIANAQKVGGIWLIPKNSEKPKDLRYKDSLFVSYWEPSRLELLQNYFERKCRRNTRTFSRQVNPEDKEKMKDYISYFETKSFQEMLFIFIDAEKREDVEVYQKAGVDRRVFSKIKSNVNYQPSFETCIRFCMALHLNVKASELLLKTAGYSLSTSKKRDLIIRYCLENEIDDYRQVTKAMELLKEE